MSKKLKIVFIVLAVVGVLVVGAVGALIYFGGQFVNGMQAVAKDIYGGPLPANVMPMIGLDVKSSKMAVLIDKDTSMAMVLIQTPNRSQPNAPFSESDVQKALAQYQHQSEYRSVLEGVGKGQPSSFQLGNQTVHTVKFTDSKGKLSEAAVLNLDKGQMVVMGSGKVEMQGSANMTHFLSQMPAVMNDSHLRPKEEPGKKVVKK
jgi:hypothetical protein